jgi:hypothetical protein
MRSFDCSTYIHNFTFEEPKKNDIVRHEASVRDMAEKIVKYLKDGFNVIQSDSDIAALTANIEATFTNLKIVKEAGPLGFSASSEGHNSLGVPHPLFVPRPRSS